MKKQNNTWKYSLYVLSFLLLFVSLSPLRASADYTAFQNIYPTNSVFGYTSPTVFGLSSGSELEIEYVATSTVTQFDRVELPVCWVGGSAGGFVYLEVRMTSSTSPIVASSSLAVNSGNFWSEAVCNDHTSATSSVFVLNNNIQWVPTSRIWFKFRYVGTTGTFFHSFTETINNYLSYANGVQLYPSAPYSIVFGAHIKGLGLGIASTTNTSCETFDVSCYFFNALSWSFIPDAGIFDQFVTLKDEIKNKPPFGYFTSAYNAIGGFNASSTPTFALATSSAITTNIFTPLRTGLNWLILFAGLYWIYKRVTDIHI